MAKPSKDLIKRPRGAQPGNLNSLTTGRSLNRAFDIGRVPRAHSGVKIRVGEFIDEMSAAYLANGGTLGPWAKGVLQEAGRWELEAMLTNTWLAKEFNKLTLHRKCLLLRAMNEATQKRNRCLRELGLNAPGASRPKSLRDLMDQEPDQQEAADDSPPE